MMPRRLRGLALCIAIGMPMAAAIGQTASPTEVTGPTLDIQSYLIDGGVPISDQETQTLLAPFVGTKGLLTNKLSKLSRTNVIVPVAVEGVAFDVDCR